MSFTATTSMMINRRPMMTAITRQHQEQQRHSTTGVVANKVEGTITSPASRPMMTAIDTLKTGSTSQKEQRKSSLPMMTALNKQNAADGKQDSMLVPRRSVRRPMMTQSMIRSEQDNQIRQVQLHF
uniref:Uncharacterized protein n=1 Tax=Grammatophora oceanica TaxID=210454 RepID=A0A7S1USF1_9STRA|mmetsp:Transcript_17700/g.26214  ORF Transcript_17700/g.26214 Transcript_17700/m.26214 type:complete len:126 (+) Transcript_17700:45-422(+)